MPIQNGSYVSPTWVDDAPPAMDAAEMQAITDTVEANQSQGATASEQALAAYATDSASGTVATFTDGADSIPVKSLVAQITPVQAGSGDPTPTNVRPITGRTGAQIYDTGINIWDEQWEVGGINADTGEPTTATDRIRSKNFIPVKGGAQYYIRAYSTCACYDKNKTYISSTPYASAPGGGYYLNIPENAYFIKFAMGVSYGTTYNNDISINYPATDTTYHSGTDNATYTATWTDEVFGGSADVATGELVSDMRSTNNFGTWNLITTATPNYFETANIVTTLDLDRITELLCNKYKTQTPSGSTTDDYICGFTTGGRLRVRDSRFDTPAAFAASLSDAQFVYPRATPTTAEFDPVEVKTLYGDNNIWADTGGVDVTYRADTGLYIQKKIAEVTA